MTTLDSETDPPAIIEAPFDAALSERYLVYALSTITARSLPDLRDGLKPVHRIEIDFMLHLLVPIKFYPA